MVKKIKIFLSSKISQVREGRGGLKTWEHFPSFTTWLIMTASLSISSKCRIWYLSRSNLGIYFSVFLVSKWCLIDTKLILDTWWVPCKCYEYHFIWMLSTSCLHVFLPLHTKQYWDGHIQREDRRARQDGSFWVLLALLRGRMGTTRNTTCATP